MIVSCMTEKEKNVRAGRILEIFKAKVIPTSLSPVSCDLLTLPHIFRFLIIHETVCTIVTSGTITNE
jgi:hypothetical protein